MWASCLSIFTILRSLLCLMTKGLPLIILIPMEYLMVTYTIAITLTYIVTSLFEYLSRMILKRVPNYNHDFLATGLQVVIFGLAFYLGALQTFGLFSVEELDDQPLLIPSSLGFVLSVECLIFGLHKLFICCKTIKISHPVIPQVEQPPPAPRQAWQSPSDPSNPVVLQVQDLPVPNVQLNTIQFNPSIETDHTNNLFVAIGFSICFVFLVAFAKAEDITGFHGYIYNLWSCFVLPLIFCTVSPKLRAFIRKTLVENCCSFD